MISLEDWKKGLASYQTHIKQAEMDLEQYTLFAKVIEEKIKELEADKHGE